MEGGYGYEAIYEALKEGGIEAKEGHPIKIKAIGYARIKTDRIDAKILADLTRSKLLPEAYVVSRGVRRIRELCRERKKVVEERTKWKNRIRSIIEKEGIEVGVKNLWTRRGEVWLKGLGIKRIERGLKMIEVLDRCIEEIEKEIEEASKEIMEEREILMSIPRIGKYSASMITGEIGDIDRFEDAEKLASYAGLVPRIEQTGEKKRMGGITKEGSKYLRWILVEVVQQHVNRYESKISEFYRRVAERRGRKREIMAAARKLLVVIYYMLKRRERFRG